MALGAMAWHSLECKYHAQGLSTQRNDYILFKIIHACNNHSIVLLLGTERCRWVPQHSLGEYHDPGLSMNRWLYII